MSKTRCKNGSFGFGEVGIDIMRNVKHSIDPKGIMNPGKVLFPLETSQ